MKRSKLQTHPYIILWTTNFHNFNTFQNSKKLTFENHNPSRLSQSNRHGNRRKSNSGPAPLFRLSRSPPPPVHCRRSRHNNFFYKSNRAAACLLSSLPDRISKLFFFFAGFLIMESFASPEEIEAMRQKMDKLLQDFDPCTTASIFSTKNQGFFFLLFWSNSKLKA